MFYTQTKTVTARWFDDSHLVAGRQHHDQPEVSCRAADAPRRRPPRLFLNEVHMNFELSEEQRAFAQSARDFALAELAPHAAHWDAEGIFPKGKRLPVGRVGLLRPLRA